MLSAVLDSACLTLGTTGNCARMSAIAMPSSAGIKDMMPTMNA